MTVSRLLFYAGLLLFAAMLAFSVLWPAPPSATFDELVRRDAIEIKLIGAWVCAFIASACLYVFGKLQQIALRRSAR